jgi:hypothetical protein
MEKEYTEASQIFDDLERMLVENYVEHQITDEEWKNYKKNQKERYAKEDAEMKELNKIVGTEFNIGDRKFKFIDVTKDFDYDEVEYIVEELIENE